MLKKYIHHEEQQHKSDHCLNNSKSTLLCISYLKRLPRPKYLKRSAGWFDYTGCCQNINDYCSIQAKQHYSQAEDLKLNSKVKVKQIYPSLNKSVSITDSWNNNIFQTMTWKRKLSPEKYAVQSHLSFKITSDRKAQSWWNAKFV